MQLVDLIFNRIFIGFVFLSILCTANAKDDGTDSSITIEKEMQSFVVNADGSFVATHDTVLLINAERAISTYAQRSLSYNRALETLDVTDAYTQKPDGHIIVVPLSEIRDQQEPRSSDARMFQDTGAKVVTFQEVAVGDRLVIKYKKNRRAALFPGQFEDISAPAFYHTRHFSLIYDMPDRLQLNADSIGFAASMPVSPAGRKIYRWDYIPTENHRVEQGSIDWMEYRPRLYVSTFADFASFAQAYDKNARDMAVITPKISELAHKITANLSDPRAQAWALANWVRKNIRSVTVPIGAAGVIPHDAGSVLDNRYGDSKDHAALMESLLAALGIDSTPALINRDRLYAAPSVPTLRFFNQVITYIPSLDIYLDSSADSIAAGYLPDNEIDKPVLLTKTGKLARTPPTQASRVAGISRFKFAADGSADFTKSMSLTGWEAEVYRAGNRTVAQADRDNLVARILAAQGQKGTGTFDPGDMSANGDDYQVKFAGHIANFLAFPGIVRIPVSSTFNSAIFDTVSGIALEKERTQPFSCRDVTMDEQSLMEMPKEATITGIPTPVTIHDAYFDYTSEYIRHENSVLIKRHYQFHHSGRVCNASEFDAMRPAIDQMVRDLTAQIIAQRL
jgi:transglutaminase-like putative cysteine protease